MPALVNVPGNILEYDVAQFILQQCNCLTVKAHGLSLAIATKWPLCNPYAIRYPIKPEKNVAALGSRSKPGTILPLGRVISMFAQWRPGRLTAKYFIAYSEYESAPETAEQRLVWFRECLAAVATYLKQEKPDTKIVAVPHGIGCGMAGGDWLKYEPILEEWAEKHKNDWAVHVVKLAEGAAPPPTPPPPPIQDKPRAGTKRKIEMVRGAN